VFFAPLPILILISSVPWYFTLYELVTYHDTIALLSSKNARKSTAAFFRVWFVSNNSQTVLIGGRDFTCPLADTFFNLFSEKERTSIKANRDFSFNSSNLSLVTIPSLFLPNTDLRFGFGHTIHLHPVGHLQEGIGVAPDICSARC